MFEKILVCIRDTTKTPIIHQAACIAKRVNATLFLYHPFSFITSGEQNSFTDPLNWTMKRAEAENRLKQIISDLSQDHIPAQWLVMENHNAQVLLNYAEENQISMIITEKPSDNMDDTFHTLMKNSTIPILSLSSETLKSDSETCFRRVLLPLDGSKRAEHILPFAAFLSENLNSEVICVHVLQLASHSPSGLSGTEEHSAGLREQLFEANHDNAIHYFEQIKKNFTVPVYFRVLASNDVAASIHQLIEDEAIDLVILSAHGIGANPKWPYGNIANNLVSYTLAPVLLVQDLPMGPLGEEAAMAHYTKSK